MAVAFLYTRIFALMIHMLSPKVYEALRDTGVLTLPSSTTLKDFTHVVAPEPGKQTEVKHYI